MNKSKQSVAGPAKPTRKQVTLPELIDIDALSIMPDDELIARIRSLEETRSWAFDVGRDPRPWEEEIAYVRREFQIRRTRREQHDQYVRRLEREFADAEAGLPVADLDNSAFLKAIGQWWN